MNSPAEWRPDPWVRHELRYWNGVEWTGHVSDGGAVSTDPASQPAWGRDPTGRHQWRYWNGTEWTDDVADDGVRSKDSPEGAPRWADLSEQQRIDAGRRIFAEFRPLSDQTGRPLSIHDEALVRSRAAIVTEHVGNGREDLEGFAWATETMSIQAMKSFGVSLDDMQRVMGLPADSSRIDPATHGLGSLAMQLLVCRPEFGGDGMFTLDTVPGDALGPVCVWYVTMLLRLERAGRIPKLA